MTFGPMTFGPVTSAPFLIAEFDSADALVAAARQLREDGHLRLETYSPFPLNDDAQSNNGGPIRPVMLAAGILGAATGFALQYWSAAIDYPINTGGRPLFSWPAFLLVTFELTILFAALAGFATFLISAGLTRLHHPIFDVPGFERASSDRFFLTITEGSREDLQPRLEALGAIAVREPQ